MLGYRGNVAKGDNCHYSSPTNVSLGEFNTCYECCYKAFTVEETIEIFFSIER